MTFFAVKSSRKEPDFRPEYAGFITVNPPTLIKSGKIRDFSNSDLQPFFRLFIRIFSMAVDLFFLRRRRRERRWDSSTYSREFTYTLHGHGGCGSFKVIPLFFCAELATFCFPKELQKKTRLESFLGKPFFCSIKFHLFR